MKIKKSNERFKGRGLIFLSLSFFCLLLYLPGIMALPPFDRDEARFVQASRQMLETGNFIDIRFQEQPRYKKPIGIYWLQSLSVALVAGGDQTALWAYRLPSLLAALAGVLLICYFGEKFFDRRTGALAAFMLASCLILVVEAHLGKTDAALFCCTVAAQGALGVIYLRRAVKILGFAILFWVATAVGILIKGPILPMISLLTIGTLLTMDKDRSWIKDLRFGLGLPLLCFLVLPWLTAIYIVSHGAFYHASLGGDLWTKLVGGQESHGAWPGYYLILTMITLFPASLFAYPAFIGAIKERHRPAVRFCLAWLIPSWLLFELAPTKLMHYVLPLYPALVLLCADCLRGINPAALFGRKTAYIAYVFWAMAGILLAGVVFYAVHTYGGGIDAPAMLAALAVLATTAGGLFYIFQKKWRKAALAASLGMVVFTTVLFHFVIPGLQTIWISPRLATQLSTFFGDRPHAPVILSGFDEPSVVFLLGSGTRFAGPAVAGRYLLEQRQRRLSAAAVVERRNFPAFAAVFSADNTPLPDKIGQVSGLNYSKGDWMDLNIYAFSQ